MIARVLTAALHRLGVLGELQARWRSDTEAAERRLGARLGKAEDDRRSIHEKLETLVDVQRTQSLRLKKALTKIDHLADQVSALGKSGKHLKGRIRDLKTVIVRNRLAAERSHSAPAPAFGPRVARRVGGSVTDSVGDLELVGQQRLRFAVPVTQPLVLISQIQRSGGTLLSQLLDGHSQLHVHPGELHIGSDKLHIGSDKYFWPDLDLTRPPAELFECLFEKPVLKYAGRGYQKMSPAEGCIDPEYRKRVLPFLFSAGLQKAVFLQTTTERSPQTQRDALDCYATSYFNAWLDYQGLYRRPERVRYWAVFCARLLARDGNAGRFFRDYPDGRAISILREPVSWFASASRHRPEYADRRAAVDMWLESYGVIAANAVRYPAQTLLLAFEDCVADTRAVMERVAAFLGIPFEPTLLEPTFNMMPIESDSSFGACHGVDRSAADRSRHVSEDAQRYIREATAGLYADLRQAVDRDARRYAS